MPMPSSAILPPWHMLALSSSLKARAVAAHLQAHVEAFLHAELRLHVGERFLADIDGVGRAEFRARSSR